MALTEATPRNRSVQEIGQKTPLTLAGSCIAGDLLGYSTGWKRALATTATAIQARLVALQSGVSGDVIEVAPAAIISGFTGGTAGGALYLEEGAGVGGGYTETAPSTGGDVNTIIGYIISASKVYANPTMRPDSTA